MPNIPPGRLAASWDNLRTGTARPCSGNPLFTDPAPSQRRSDLVRRGAPQLWGRFLRSLFPGTTVRKAFCSTYKNFGNDPLLCLLPFNARTVRSIVSVRRRVANCSVRPVLRRALRMGRTDVVPSEAAAFGVSMKPAALVAASTASVSTYGAGVFSISPKSRVAPLLVFAGHEPSPLKTLMTAWAKSRLFALEPASPDNALFTRCQSNRRRLRGGHRRLPVPGHLPRRQCGRRHRFSPRQPGRHPDRRQLPMPVQLPIGRNRAVFQWWWSPSALPFSHAVRLKILDENRFSYVRNIRQQVKWGN